MKKFIERTQHGGGVNADLAKKSLRFVSEKGRGFRKQFSKTFLSGILTLTLLVTTVISADFV
ncbi:MAG: hypothetical protein LBK04_07380, partial [Clostridiales Family XIII bacterium]|nr:hypothetical protein [Clostridiales Family XIII bacterium]